MSETIYTKSHGATEFDVQKMKELAKIPGKHKIVKYLVTPSLPVNEGKTAISLNVGLDSYGIKYTIFNDTLTIDIGDMELDPLFIEYISNLPDFVKKIVITGFSNIKPIAARFNSICSLLEKNRSKAKIILDIYNVGTIKRNSKLDFEKLPNNVFVSNHEIDEVGEEADYLGDRDTCFNAWMLWLSDEDFSTVIERLTPNTKKKALKEAEIVRKMYLAFKQAEVDRLSDRDKTLLVFEWCMKNVRYSTENLKADGNLKEGCEFERDSVATYERGKGVCVGRANLMKLLLNNRFMRVDCFLESGRHGKMGNSLGHVWNVVFYENGDVRRYDLSYGIRNCKKLPPVYFDTLLERSIPSDVMNPITSPHLPPLPVQTSSHRNLPPPLPNRRNGTPPPLPPQHGSK